MLARIRKAQTENEGGFTLIELLVVIIIIGILAAIAIPVFLNQRQKGYDAQAKSDLRNLATLEESYLTDYSAYAADVATLTAAGLNFKASPNATTSVLGTTGATGFCLTSVSTSGKTFYYSSTGGGVSSTACTNS
jgi:type IV pilus assembly protein PilA